MILYNHAYKRDKGKRERKVNRICTDRHYCAITAKITAITTQKLHRCNQRKGFAEKQIFVGGILLYGII